MPNYQQRSTPFRYSMKEPYMSVTCVYKLFFGNFYFISKALRLHQQLKNYSIQIDRDLRNGMKEGSIFTKVIPHIRKYRAIMMTAEVVLESDNAFEILCKERELLQAGKDDAHCLNHYFDVAFPQWIPETTIHEYQAFITKLSREKARKTIEAKNAAAGKKSKSSTTKAKPVPVEVTPVVIAPAAGKKSKSSTTKAKPVPVEVTPVVIAPAARVRRNTGSVDQTNKGRGPVTRIETKLTADLQAAVTKRQAKKISPEPVAPAIAPPAVNKGGRPLGRKDSYKRTRGPNKSLLPISDLPTQPKHETNEPGNKKSKGS